MKGNVVMHPKIIKLLKFLFPEWQVFDDIKRYGFIYRKKQQAGASKHISNRDSTLQPRSQAEHGNPTTSTQRQGPLPTIGQPQASQGKVPNYTRDISDARTIQRKKSATTAHTSADRIDQIFQTIRASLGQEIIGQRQFLDELCLAFKRPFVTGMEPIKPKNAIVVIGHPGSGRRKSVTTLVSLLHEHRLIRQQTIAKIDLASYTTASEFNLFLSDLYTCLYGASDLVLFENIDKAPSKVIDAITALTSTGFYQLPARYTVEQNKLIETTGMLTEQTISDIYANGKFFVFLYEKSKESLADLSSRQFIDAIGDIVHIDPYHREDINNLAWFVISELQQKCQLQLSLTIEVMPEVADNIAQQFNEKTGVTSMQEYVDHYIFKALAEMRLRDIVPTDEPIYLHVKNNKLIAICANDELPLNEYVRQMETLGLEDLQQELDQIVGIESVKKYILTLEDHVKVQKMREEKGVDTGNISMHMVFTGNPGTGKTMMARFVAKYLKALGVLSTGQLREVTRADLVGEYVGQTARLTSDMIKSALGGVLFIDEAYTLYRDEHDTFGIEAIDTLVKGMEDYRDDLVVILAGYSNEMDKFFQANPGLKSRFPNIVHFPDYTSEEMWEIANIMSQQKGYEIDPTCKEPLINVFDKSQIKGRNDSGNGRLVRNIIEAAILKQSQRILHEQESRYDLLVYDDFNFEDHSSFDLEASLAQIVGLKNVKDFIRTQQKLLIAQQKRQEAGLNVDTTQSLHMVFVGNPGTGKTTVARIMAQMFKEMGLLKAGRLVEVDSSDLTGQYVGQTAKKTEEVFRSALGGVLFIDEAYALATNNSSFGAEAINTLVKLLEDYREEIVVILAGYEQEMKEFLQANSGLESRFPLRVEFPDYTAEELFEIAKMIIADKGFILAEDAKPVLKEEIERMHRHASAHSGNGRMVRNYIEEITRNQSARIAINEVAPQEMNIILPLDIKPTEKVLKTFDLETELANIIGLEEVKDYIRGLHARLRIQAERKKLGLPVTEQQTLHMIFTGNPGTGKTMMARIVANVLYNIGMIQTNKLVETDRSGLVAGYVGQTALKTREVIEEALDGVLFIDEAYALAQGHENDFGKEAIDTLVKMMDDYRDRLVVILAGYPQDMERFLLQNPGLRSRFPNIIEFPDYDLPALMDIAKKFYHDNGFKLTVHAEEKLAQIFIEASQQYDFGNGRYVRNVFERSLNLQAKRLSQQQYLSEKDLIEITDQDIEGV